MFEKKEQPQEDLKAREEKAAKEIQVEQAQREAVESKEKTVQILELEYKKLLEEAAQGKEYKDKYIRLYAEFDNARKRMEREKSEFIKYANEGLLADFLNILDDLERSVEAARAKHEDYEAFLKGIELVMAHVYELLKKNGITTMEAKGKKFDPHCHEVLMQEESENHDNGEVLEEFQKGYFLEDKVLRTAKVKVARSK